jgi:hypothetical protein
LCSCPAVQLWTVYFSLLTVLNPCRPTFIFVPLKSK